MGESFFIVMPGVLDLAGEWVPDSQGDADEFMAAAGIGWMTRKAVGLAQAAGFGKKNYTIEVEQAGENFHVRITDGKKDNSFTTDGSTFEYEGPTGNVPTTCIVEDGKLVMTSEAQEGTPEIVTYRFVNDDGHYVTTATVPSKEGVEWTRTCVRA